ncbi:MAG TPA: type II toxin-antitoxin system HicA family toxin [Lacibacter sp.]|nr:type II toxin-antitoxin system HicA family toxin [Lacibacter sp.]
MKSSELIRLLQRDGWYVVRQKGSHMILQHPVKMVRLFVPIMEARRLARDWKRKLKRMLVFFKFPSV